MNKKINVINYCFQKKKKKKKNNITEKYKEEIEQEDMEIRHRKISD